MVDTSPSIITPITAALAKTLDLAFAWYISAHITAGYEFLMSTYSPGDKICLFGFSRGAYTARALAGMLEKVGLIHPDNFEMVNFAYVSARFRTSTATTSPQIRRADCVTVCRLCTRTGLRRMKRSLSSADASSRVSRDRLPLSLWESGTQSAVLASW